MHTVMCKCSLINDCPASEEVRQLRCIINCIPKPVKTIKAALSALKLSFIRGSHCVQGYLMMLKPAG